MKTERRNPYLILGVPYGTDRETATTAFAQRSRKARRDHNFPYDVDDLTWALNRIEGQISNAATDLETFRIPADPEALSAPGSTGLLRLPPQRFHRTTPVPTADEVQVLEGLARGEALAELLDVSARQAIEHYGLDRPDRPAPSPAFRATNERGVRMATIAAWTVVVLIIIGVVLLATMSGPSNDDASATITAATAPPTTAPATVPPTEPPPPPAVDPLIEFLPLAEPEPGLDLNADIVRTAQELLQVVCCPDVVASGAWDDDTEQGFTNLRTILGLPAESGLDEELWAAIFSIPAPEELETKNTSFLGVSVPTQAVRVFADETSEHSGERYVLAFHADPETVRQWADDQYLGRDLFFGEFQWCGHLEEPPGTHTYAWAVDDNTGLFFVVSPIAAGRVDIGIWTFDPGMPASEWCLPA